MKLNHIFPQTIGIAHYPDADHDAMRIAKHMNGTKPFIYNPHHDQHLDSVRYRLFVGRYD